MMRHFKTNAVIMLIATLIMCTYAQAATVGSRTTLGNLLSSDSSEEDFVTLEKLQEMQHEKIKEEIKKAEAEKKSKEAEAKKARIKKFDEPVTLYTKKTTVVKKEPEGSKNVIGQLAAGEEVICTGQIKGTNYYITEDEKYISCLNLTDDQYYFTYNHDWDGEILNKNAGVVLGPKGYESYYNLNMNGIISIMRSMGFDEEEYPYWIRDDGCKMLGNYIMVAADLSKYPRGTTSMCSLGQCIICDTGGFIHSTNRVFDVAVNW